jgi:hypothetical protein
MRCVAGTAVSYTHGGRPLEQDLYCYAYILYRTYLYQLRTRTLGRGKSSCARTCC